MAKILTGQRGLFGSPKDVTAKQGQWRTQFIAASNDDIGSIGLLWGGDNGDTGLDDARLFRCDLADGRSKKTPHDRG